MPGAARLPVDDWAEQCERCRPAARALRHQLEEARARIVELESQVGRLQLEVGVLRVQPQPPMRRSLQAVSTPGGVDGGKGKMHGIMVPYRGPSSGASVSERERGGLPFSSASSTVSTYSYAAGRTPKLPTPPGMLVHAAPEGPGAVLARLLTKEFWTGQEDPQQRAAHAAKLLQARVRGWRQRARFRAAREVFAVVSGTSTFASPSSKRTVTTYVITVVRAGCCWQVEHRYSDWRRLNELLAKAVGPRDAPLPPFPSRLPFGGSTVESHRQFVLNRYLQGLVHSNPSRSHRARSLLMAFLCRSHYYWEYDSRGPLLFTGRPGQAPAAHALDLITDTGGGELADPHVHDRSTGTTPVSLVVHAGPEARTSASAVSSSAKPHPAVNSALPRTRNEWQAALDFWDEAPPRPPPMPSLAPSPRAAVAGGYIDARRERKR